MARYQGRHRRPRRLLDAGTTRRTLARTAVTGAVVGTPLLAALPAAQAAPDTVWDRVANCESSGNWAINTGNGFSGGLQFTPSTWSAFGGSEFAVRAFQASRDEQIVVAERVLADQGWGAWPVCSRKANAGGQPATQRSAPVVQPSVTQPAVNQPAVTRPAVNQPAVTRPAVNQPAVTQPAGTPTAGNQPAVTQPAVTQPVTAPAAAQPVTAPAAAQPAATPAPTDAGSYVVRAGDTLSSIAADLHVAGGWQALSAHNPGVVNPNRIFVGELIAE